MPRTGLPDGRLIAAAWTALGAFAAALPALCLWGFTVDDALISVRYARHVADGLGWRFNAPGASTDGVTPLPWPVLLVPLARADAVTVFLRAKALGLLAWTLTGACLGHTVGAEANGRRTAALAGVGALFVLALSVPVAAHAVSGMETAIATALATGAALTVRWPRRAACFAGLAASLRPEMAPWAVVLGMGASIVDRSRPARTAAAGALAFGPFVGCAILRALAWGRPAPLAVLAKPSDLEHGIAYAGAACVVTLVPLLVVAPWTLRRCPRARVIVAAAIAHVAAIAVVGGDWMPYARLMVPVVPSLAYAGALLGGVAMPWATSARTAVAVALGLALLGHGGASGRSVGADRAQLIELARPWLRDTRAVAALDVGWVSAATESAIVDLAGVTDPAIAVLPGGHTSKRVDARFLLDRAPETLLLYAPDGLPDGLESWASADYPRVVEGRLAHDAVIQRHFGPAAWLPLGTKGAGYILLRTREK